MQFFKNKQLIMGILIGVILFVDTILLVVVLNNKKDDYYQVIFDSSGGSEVAGQNIESGGLVKEPSITTKEGYVFKGWYLGKKKYDFSLEIEQDLILKAKWEKIEDKSEVDSKEDEANNDNKDEKNEDTSQNVVENSVVTKKEETTTSNKKEETTPKPQTPTKPTTIEVTSISLNVTNLSLKVGESSTLVASVLPTNATNKSVSWKSSNNSVVTVSNGIVKAVGAGDAVITATSGGKSVSCSVKVTKVITYTYEMVDIPSSAIGQCYIYIKSSEGQRVSGTITINYINGESENVVVTSSGVIKVRSTISSVTVVSAG